VGYATDSHPRLLGEGESGRRTPRVDGFDVQVIEAPRGETIIVHWRSPLEGRPIELDAGETVISRRSTEDGEVIVTDGGRKLLVRDGIVQRHIAGPGLSFRHDNPDVGGLQEHWPREVRRRIRQFLRPAPRRTRRAWRPRSFRLERGERVLDTRSTGHRERMIVTSGGRNVRVRQGEIVEALAGPGGTHDQPAMRGPSIRRGLFWGILQVVRQPDTPEPPPDAEVWVIDRDNRWW
jgi:hypothetical protein